jgi:hypothetical protein
MRPNLASLSVFAVAAWTMTVPASPAAGQCRLCDTPAGGADQRSDEGPVTLEIATSLDFDRLILLGSGEGSATLLPDGTRSVSGAIGDIGGRAMVGSVIIHGEAGRAVRIELPHRIELFSLSGGRILIEDIISDAQGSARLNGSGTLEFRFGGRLRVSGDADGEYRGDVPITVEYL